MIKSRQALLAKKKMCLICGSFPTRDHLVVGVGVFEAGDTTIG